MKRNQNNNNYLKILLVCGFIGIGFIIGKVTSFSGWQIDDKINVVELSSLFFAIIAAAYFSGILDRQKENNRYEKDIFLRRIDEVNSLIDPIRYEIISRKISLDMVNSHLKQINLSTRGVFELLKKNGFIDSGKLQDTCLASIKRLRELMTTSPINPPLRLPADVAFVKGEVHYSSERVREIENQYDVVRNNFMLLQLAINKA